MVWYTDSCGKKMSEEQERLQLMNKIFIRTRMFCCEDIRVLHNTIASTKQRNQMIWKNVTEAKWQRRCSNGQSFPPWLQRTSNKGNEALQVRCHYTKLFNFPEKIYTPRYCTMASSLLGRVEMELWADIAKQHVTGIWEDGWGPL